MRLGLLVISCAVLALLGAGCTAKQYRKRADREVYGIIQEAQTKAFGSTNAFTIETEISGRDPESISPRELIENRNGTGSRLLTIDEALNLAVENSRRYQTEKERLYLTALTLSGERYEFGPQFFARTRATYERQSNGDRRGVVNTDIGVSQTLKTGGRISVGILNDLLRYYTGDPRRSAVSTITVNLVQPLLRGFGKYNTAVENLTQAERNVLYAVRNFSYFQNQYAISIVSDYFNLLAQKDIVRNRYTNYLSRVQATRRLEARAVDRERAIDVDQARQAELSAKNNYVNAVASYLNSMDQFKIELALPIGENIHLEDSALKDLEKHGLMPLNLSGDTAYKIATERQLQVLNQIDRFEDAKRKIKVSANRLKADINLIADASLNSDGPTDYTKFDPDNIRAGVGVELDLPLDRLRERNNYRATLISFDSEVRNLSLALDTLKDNIERGLRTLEQRRQTYEIQQSALQVANRRVVGATQLVEAGRAEVRDLVEAQDAQVAAQNAVTSALVSYQDTLLSLMLDIGVLETESSQFWLKNHLASYQSAPAQPPAENDFADQELAPPDQVF